MQTILPSKSPLFLKMT